MSIYVQSPGELELAYDVLAEHFGVSHYDLKKMLMDHFEARTMVTVTPKQDTVSSEWTIDEIRQTFRRIDVLREKGEMKPLVRYVVMSTVRKGKKGKEYIASDEQLQEELAIQGRSSIDSNGNLVTDGQIVKYGWLQSFDKKDE